MPISLETYPLGPLFTGPFSELLFVCCLTGSFMLYFASGSVAPPVAPLYAFSVVQLFLAFPAGPVSMLDSAASVQPNTSVSS